jgi:phosphatidylserine decarboxylase
MKKKHNHQLLGGIAEPNGTFYSSTMRIPIAPEGIPIIKWLWFVWLLSLLTINELVIGFFTVLVVFVMSFFRDPLRHIERQPNVVYSAADGVITQVNDVQINGISYKQIVTFLSVFNCHVNRIPLTGQVIETTHVPGLFLAAMRGDIDKKNERQETDIQTSIGLVRVVQITGAIARRICCDLAPQQQVTTGERFGLIRFGSRTDVYVPSDAVNVLVKKGDKVKGGLTHLATLNA